MRVLLERWRTGFRIIAPILVTMVFLAGLLGVIRLPGYFSSHFSSAEYGHAGAALQVIYWSGLSIVLYSIVFSVLVAAIISIWCIFTARRYHDLEMMWDILKMGLLAVGLSAGLACFMIFSEDLPGEIRGARADMALLQQGEALYYEGTVGTRGAGTYPGVYYEDKPKAFIQLRILADSGWQSVLCPLALAEESGVADMTQSDEPKDAFALEYLPNTRIITEIQPLAG